MDSAAGRKLRAYAGPMIAFVLLLALGGILKHRGAGVWLRAPEYWIYPLQTLVCAALLWVWRGEYDLSLPRRPLFATSVAILVFVIWIAPQAFFGFAPRVDGFNPLVFGGEPVLFWFELIFRFARLVAVVPLVEEIFWRGFLLRYLIDENFARVPVGAFSWFSFAAVTLAFMFTHAMPDWPAALVCGAVYNLVAYRTRSLASCVMAHAITNLLLGIWITHTRQWGFW